MNTLRKLLARYDLWAARRHMAVLARDGRLQLPSNYTLRDAPIIEVVPGARIELGSGVVLDSAQRGYHVAMWGPTRLLADREGAVIRIGANSRIHGSGIHAEGSITIGERCLLAANCQLFDANGHVLAMDEPARRLDTAGPSRPIVLEDDVWLGTGVIVLPGTHIGAGSVISAGAVVSGTVPPRTLMRGNPAVPVERPIDAQTRVQAMAER